MLIRPWGAGEALFLRRSGFSSAAKSRIMAQLSQIRPLRCHHLTCGRMPPSSFAARASSGSCVASKLPPIRQYLSQVFSERELLVEVPLPMVEVWEELQARSSS